MISMVERSPSRPSRAARRVAFAATLLFAVSCSSGGGGGPVYTAPVADASGGSDGQDASAAEWSAEMTKAQLLAIAASLGLDVDEGDDKDDIVDALEEATGCGCFGAECGVGACGHDCGACSERHEYCFAGLCETQYTCPIVPVAITEQSAVLKEDGESLRLLYEATVPGKDLDSLRIVSNATPAAPLGAGTTDLARQDLATCGLCVFAYKGCNGGECAETYVATAGSVALTEPGDGARLVGTMSDLRFEQAYEDPKTGKIFILPKAKRKCVATLAIDAPVEHLVIEPGDCLPGGTGITMGSQIADVALPNCHGDLVHLHDFCGAKAVWIDGVAGWCGACKSHLPEVVSAWKQHQIKGLEILVALSEDEGSMPPTPEYCAAFAAQMGVPPERMLIDPNFDGLFSVMDSGGGGSLSLPWEGVFDGRGMFYEWRSEDGPGGDAFTVVTELLDED